MWVWVWENFLKLRGKFRTFFPFSPNCTRECEKRRMRKRCEKSTKKKGGCKNLRFQFRILSVRNVQKGKLFSLFCWSNKFSFSSLLQRISGEWKLWKYRYKRYCMLVVWCVCVRVCSRAAVNHISYLRLNINSPKIHGRQHFRYCQLQIIADVYIWYIWRFAALRLLCLCFCRELLWLSWLTLLVLMEIYCQTHSFILLATVVKIRHK